MDKTILITGATSGFGKAIAQLFAEHKWNLIITGRRKDRLAQLSEELKQKYHIEILPLVFDVQDRNAVFDTLEHIPDEWKKIDVLVNNAGLALGREPFDKANIDDWETMLNTNVKGLMYVTKAVLPFMIPQKKGHIINIGSIAGKEVYVNGNGYCASKHAVDALSKAMRIDLLPHKIKVTAIHPGAAETEFSMVRFKGNEVIAKSVYEGYTPLYAEDIANITFYCATLPVHVCINELIVTSTAQANSTTFFKE
ncbi:MAG: SDR family NAD(P)-dependent oxidoreductase [Bacteroidota bacterium]|jgi:NADP-dependent 3-hydroxy acid dehydrogenase YdfG|nr:SDR family NAD(P)-dependent oxidoreductase [Bacteroidota bacterium]